MSTHVVRAALAALTFGAAALPQAWATGIPGQGTWETDLEGRYLSADHSHGFDAFYDKALDVTWLANAGAFKGTWGGAQYWAAHLDVDGVSGWRLPIMVDTGAPGCAGYAYVGTDCGYNVDPGTSELVHMFYVTLGNKARYDTLGHKQTGSFNSGPFSNLAVDIYWSGVAYGPDTDFAWAFVTTDGAQARPKKLSSYYAWAVHSGDVAEVSEPPLGALALFGSGVVLAATGRMKRCEPSGRVRR